MKLRQLAISSLLSVLLAAPAFSQADENSMSRSNAQSSDQSQASNNQQSASESENSNNQQHGNQEQATGNQVEAPVKVVQTKLKNEGYYKGDIDGIWGPNSSRALKMYQKDKDLRVTGHMDKDTADKLGLSQADMSAFEQAVRSNRGSSQQASTNASNQEPQRLAAAIEVVQRKLKKAGYYKGERDGKWGPEDVNALRQYQQAKGINNPHGEMNEDTADELNLSDAEFSAFQQAMTTKSTMPGGQSESGNQQSGDQSQSPAGSNGNR